MVIVEYHVIDNYSGCVQFARQLLAIGTDAADIATVMDMHGSCGRIEDLNLRVIPGRSGDRLLLTRIVEGAERIGSRINGRRRDVRTIHRVQIAHRGSVGPSGDVNPGGIDVAGRELGRNEMIDRGRVRIFPPGRVSDLYVTRWVQLAIPIIPSNSRVVRKWVVVRRFAPLRSQHDVSDVFRIIGERSEEHTS